MDLAKRIAPILVFTTALFFSTGLAAAQDQIPRFESSEAHFKRMNRWKA